MPGKYRHRATGTTTKKPEAKVKQPHDKMKMILLLSSLQDITVQLFVFSTIYPINFKMQTTGSKKKLERKQEGKNGRAEKMEAENQLESLKWCKREREGGLQHSSTGGKDGG